MKGAPKKFKVQQWVGKVIARTFWDSGKIILADYKRKGQTITEAYYTNILIRFQKAIKQNLTYLYVIASYKFKELNY